MIKEQVLREENDPYKNMISQRRIYQNPTVTIFMPSQLEETNRVIRKKFKYVDYFLRIVLVTNNLDKDYYFNKYSGEIIKFVREVLVKGIFVGDRHFETLNYSSS